ncbi:MAG TPA: putative metallopeptidase [Patescibacteria group bacterium]|jgi:predicted metallopeptidase|nr:putative metallopeptidase [Patescibacteria group bacterium]
MRIKTSQTKVQESKLGWQKAPDVKRDVSQILKVIDLPYIKANKIFCYRTLGSKSRSYARIWSFPKIFQDALGLEPAYVIEVLSRHYDKLEPEEKIRVLIHELLHIPRNFSGALVPHVTQSRHLGRTANALFDEYRRAIINK